MELKPVYLQVKHTLKLLVKINNPSVIRILKSVWLNILPQCRNYFSSCFLLYSENTCKLSTQHKSLWRAFKVKYHFNCELTLICICKWSFNLNSIVVWWWHLIFNPFDWLVRVSSLKSYFNFFKKVHHPAFFVLHFSVQATCPCWLIACDFSLNCKNPFCCGLLKSLDYIFLDTSDFTFNIAFQFNFMFPHWLKHFDLVWI